MCRPVVLRAAVRVRALTPGYQWAQRGGEREGHPAVLIALYAVE